MKKSNKIVVSLNVNGLTYEVLAEPHAKLLEVLRENVGLKGVKSGCEEGECGACAILLDGEPVTSCMMLAGAAVGKEIVTIEGLAKGGKLHPLQEAFMKYHGMQCGYCTPGAIIAAKGLLDKNPNPTDQEVRDGFSGNLCRCGSYPKMVKSVLEAAKVING
ncbi:(2Fe-2S)-binding protein [Neoaquamicrobium sediminum]|uniref:(2Fe-2S)-binding protein n=1 Tax=Neoaquamicrobium sediminum TaxID=1849104 RepID=UPI00156676F8|nr:(2Fe-2S)-binding protein [Mesorhizobium sediminum]NRC57215.1 (2Fe-2S)-binding protein [Mesorhizobium sediminum]